MRFSAEQIAEKLAEAKKLGLFQGDEAQTAGFYEVRRSTGAVIEAVSAENVARLPRVKLNKASFQHLRTGVRAAKAADAKPLHFWYGGGEATAIGNPQQFTEIPPKEETEASMATERELTDAKLEAVEARVEARLSSIEGKIDRLGDQFAAGIQRSVEASDRAAAAAKVAEDRAEEARKAAGSTKWNIFATGLTVIAVVVAIWAVWHQGIEMVSGLLAAQQNTPPST